MKGKSPGGRPSKKKTIKLGLVEMLASFALTDAQISKALGISEKSLNNYKHDEKFLQALKAGKDIADGRVERSLFERATGYSHPDTDIRAVEGEIVKTDIIKHYPPDTTACIFWLKNRKRREWRDKQQIEFPDKDGNPQDISGRSSTDMELAVKVCWILENASKKLADEEQQEIEKGGVK
jgi:hypothetical protein